MSEKNANVEDPYLKLDVYRKLIFGSRSFHSGIGIVQNDSKINIGALNI